jgi:hypothetical protein
MKAMTYAFVGDISPFPLNHLLELASFPHRPISVGVDCLPIDPTQASIFTSTPKEIAFSLLIRSKLLSNSVPPVAPAWEELTRIPGLPTWAVDDSSAAPFLPAATTRPTTLSSNQIFLGIMSSPRVVHLVTSAARMLRAMDNDFLGIEAALRRIDGMAMSVRELESRVHAVAAHLESLLPPARSSAGHLQSIKDNWSVIELAMTEMGNQENPGTVR